MKIFAPVGDFNGLRNNVRFVNGVGETDDPQVIEWFVSHGYNVPIEEERVETESDPIETVDIVDDEPEMMGYPEKETKEPDFENMSPFEIREWAKEHDLGLKIGNTRNKEKLIEIVRG